MEYCCYLGIQVFRLLFARGLRIPPYLRCCAYTWPCAMHRVPGRLRTCAERRLGACLCRLGYGNLAGFPSPRSTFVADINLSIPKERGKNGMPLMGKNVRGLFSSGRQSLETVSRYRVRPMNRRGKRKPDTSWKLKCREYHARLLRTCYSRLVPHEGIEPPLRRELGFEPSASTSSANGALILDGPEKEIRKISKSRPEPLGRYRLT